MRKEMWKETWTKIIRWLRKTFKRYEAEIQQFVDNMLDLAFQNLVDPRKEKLTDAVKKNIRAKVLADIMVMGIDISTTKGKSETGKIIMDAIDWFTKDAD